MFRLRFLSTSTTLRSRFAYASWALLRSVHVSVTLPEHFDTPFTFRLHFVYVYIIFTLLECFDDVLFTFWECLVHACRKVWWRFVNVFFTFNEKFSLRSDVSIFASLSAGQRFRHSTFTLFLHFLYTSFTLVLHYIYSSILHFVNACFTFYFRQGELQFFPSVLHTFLYSQYWGELG